jgi:GTP cyclohydrolase II
MHIENDRENIYIALRARRVSVHVSHCLFFISPLLERTMLMNAVTKTAVRVHNECSGSDTFGTDICTCRPYLVYALLAAVQCAQRGGVGIIIYFRKEGRSLGEVTKFRVYNVRKRQAGGDTAENYFRQTESMAGIRDARF